MGWVFIKLYEIAEVHGAAYRAQLPDPELKGQMSLLIPNYIVEEAYATDSDMSCLFVAVHPQAKINRRVKIHHVRT